ncbi:alpha tubulin 2, partial [Plasmodium reichenowi]|jgi:hypothetical protein
MREV